MSSLQVRAEFAAARVIQLLRHLRRSTNPAVAAARRQRASFYHQAWTEAATAIGAETLALGDSIREIRLRSRRTLVDLNYTAIDHPVTLRLAGDKSIVHDLLRSAGVPVPAHCVFDTNSLNKARRFMQQTVGPCVVKPQRQTGAGQGVTTGVRTHRQLIWAAATAAAHRKGLQIENQIAGKNYRLLFLDGELLDVVRRDPPAVVGDGRSSVRDLVARANRERLDGGFASAQTLLLEDQAMLHTLSRQGLTWRAVPALGREVQVSDIINDNRACENVEAREEVCQAIVKTAARAAEVLGVRLAGVDVITTDPTRTLEGGGGVVLEVNTAPGFYMHYYRRGEPCRVAEHVLVQLLGNTMELDNQRSGARVRAF